MPVTPDDIFKATTQEIFLSHTILKHIDQELLANRDFLRRNGWLIIPLEQYHPIPFPVLDLIQTALNVNGWHVSWETRVGGEHSIRVDPIRRIL